MKVIHIKSSGKVTEDLFSPQVQRWLKGLFLVAAVIFAYQQAWNAGFVWDDDIYVTQNQLLSAPDGLKRIWFSLDSPSQYFPLVYTTFRWERGLWGLNPAGYHWVNILLHAANALLVWRLLRRLGVPGAWLAAAIFALHPVQVESVAWITERKNVLTLFFSLFTMLAWVEFAEEQKPRWRFYVLALMFYALALFSKTTACTLPAALLLILWLKEKPIDWRRWVQMVPFLASGASMGLVAIWWERHHQGVASHPFTIGVLDRVLIASHAVWFYLGKLIWPVNLSFSYPRWTIDPTDPLAYGWLLAVAALGVAIYFARRFFGRSVEVAFLFYIATLAPLLGFIMLSTFQYSFVADHYQYVASIGPLALAAVGITRGLGLVERKKPFLKPVICGTLLLVLGILSWRQAGMYADLETLWRRTIERNPRSFMAHTNLGIILFARGEVNEAIAHYRKALEAHPAGAQADYDFGNALFASGQVDEAIIHYRKALEIEPDGAAIAYKLGNALVEKEQVDEAIIYYRKALEILPTFEKAHSGLGNALVRKGRLEEAIAHYETALRIQPTDVVTLANLSWVLATCPDPSLRNGSKAVELAQQAERLTEGKSPDILKILSAAYAEAGRFPEALATARRALGLQDAKARPAYVEEILAQIKLYEASSPLCDPSLTHSNRNFNGP